LSTKNTATRTMTKNEEDAPPKAHCAVQEDEARFAFVAERKKKKNKTRTRRGKEKKLRTL
jgi:hypothetical protein